MADAFPFGKPVSGRHLVGREELISQLAEIVKNGQSVMLVAPRRFGKTSIVIEILRRLKADGMFTGDVDLFDVVTKKELAEKIVGTTLDNKGLSGEKLVDLAKKGIQTLTKSMELKCITDGGFEIILNFGADNVDEDALLDDGLDFPERFSSRHGKRMAFAYDEFADIAKINGNTVKKMRAKFQRHNNVTYIFAGSQESLMYKMFKSRGEPFYGFSRIIKLPKIPQSDFADYIIQTFKEGGISADGSVAKYITDKTDCHPYYTQFLCHLAYHAAKSESGKLTNKAVDAAYSELFDSQIPYLERLWDSLSRDSPVQLKVCRFIAIGGKSPYSFFQDRRQNVYKALVSLEAKGIIKKEGKSIEMLDPLLKHYLAARTKGFEDLK
jgi:AAA+ ATPase superfamily predicted ATPase